MKKLIIISLMLAGLAIAACQNKPSDQAGNQTREPDSDLQNSATHASDPLAAEDSTVYESETLVIKRLSDHAFQHISYLHTDDFGKVPCNGMIVIRNNEAVVFDTPADLESSEELLQYLTETKHYTINAVIATHFHLDCVAGLAGFHQRRIPSYANKHTIALLKQKGDDKMVPQHGFDKQLEIKVAEETVIAEFFGEGHTNDNVIGYYPAEKILFGGCLIKEMNAGEGNLEDANVAAWPETVRKIKAKYPETAIIIPGHGKTGGTELLDYTIKLFDPDA